MPVRTWTVLWMMRNRTLMVGLIGLACLATLSQPVYAQSELVGLGARLAVLQTLSVANTVDPDTARTQTMNIRTDIAGRNRQAFQSLRFMQLVKAANLDELLTTYAANAVMILPDGESLSVHDLPAWYAEAFDRLSVSSHRTRIDPGGIQQVGEYAVATGFVVTELEDQKKQVSQLSVSAEFKLLLVRENGEWRVLRQSFSGLDGSWTGPK